MASFKSSEVVGNTMRKAWVNFASTGEPSIPEFEWPEYEEDKLCTVSIDEELTLLQDPYRYQRGTLVEVLAMNWHDRGVCLHLAIENRNKSL